MRLAIPVPILSLSDHSTSLLAQALSDQGHDVVYVTNPEEARLAGEVDGCVPRWIWGGVSIPAAVSAGLYLELNGVKMLNSTSSMMAAADKRLSQELFIKARLPVPPLFGECEGPWLCKPAAGALAGGIYVAETEQQVKEILAFVSEPYKVQKQIIGAKVWRVICSPRQTLGGYVWTPNPDSFSPVGAKTEMLTPPQNVRALATSMVEATSGDLMGCDILEDPDGGLWALEVNGCFGVIPFEGSLSADWAEYVVNHLS